MAITVECEHCGARLKLKDDSKVGKTVPCPKCKEPFLVEEVDDEFEVVEEDEDFEPVPKKKAGGGSSAKKGKGKGKGKKGKSSDGPPLVLIGGIVALVLVAVGVGLWAMGVFGGGGGGEAPVAAVDPAPAAPEPEKKPAPAPAPANNIDFTYLPADSLAIISCKVSEILKAPMLAEFVAAKEFQDGLAETKRTFGVSADQISSITVAVVQDEQGNGANAGPAGMGIGAPQLPLGIPGMALPGMGAQPKPPKFVAVIRATSPVDLSAAAEIDQENPLSEVNGIKILKVKTPQEEVSIAKVKSDTLVIGTPALVENAAKGGNSDQLKKRFAIAGQQAHQLVLSVSMDQMAEEIRKAGESAGQLSPAQQMQKEQFDKGIRGFLAAASVTDTLKLKVGAILEGDAKTVKQDVETGLKGIKDKFAEVQEFLPEASRGAISSLVTGVKLISESSVAGVEVSASMEQLVAAQSAVPVVMGMAMSGAFNAPPKSVANRGEGESDPAAAMMMAAGDSSGGTATADGLDGAMAAEMNAFDGYDPAGAGFDGGFGAGAAPSRTGIRMLSGAVPLTKAEGLPEGVSGQVAVSEGYAQNQPAVQVDLLFTSTGDERVVGYTLNKIGTITDEAGTVLSRAEGSFDLFPGPNGFAPVEHVELEQAAGQQPAASEPKPALNPFSFGFGGGGTAATGNAASPAGTVAVPITLHGTTDVRQLTGGSGTIRLLLAAEAQNIQIEDVHSSVGQLTANSEPGSLGVRVERGTDGELLLFSIRPDAVLTGVQALDVSGLPSASAVVYPEMRGGAAVYAIYPAGNQPLPIPLKVKLDVASGLSTKDVTYGFGPVSVPGDRPIPSVATDSVPSERNLPDLEGGSVRGVLRWGPETAQKIPTLEISLRMTGTPFENAVSTGRYSDDGARVGTNKLPPLKKDQIAAYQKRPQGFDPVDRATSPVNGCEALFGFVVPPRATLDVITSFSGSVKVKRAGNVVVVDSPQLETLIGRPISAPLLDENKLVVIPSIDGNTLTVTVDDGDYSLVRSVQLLSPEGGVLPVLENTMTVERRKGIWRLTPIRSDYLDGAGLRVELFSDISEIEVPFLFKDLKVPSQQAGGNQGGFDNFIEGSDPGMNFDDADGGGGSRQPTRNSNASRGGNRRFNPPGSTPQGSPGAPGSDTQRTPPPTSSGMPLTPGAPGSESQRTQPPTSSGMPQSPGAPSSGSQRTQPPTSSGMPQSPGAPGSGSNRSGAPQPPGASSSSGSSDSSGGSSSSGS